MFTVWNSIVLCLSAPLPVYLYHSLFHLYLAVSANLPSIPLSPLSLCTFANPPPTGVNDFAFYVGRPVEEEIS